MSYFLNIYAINHSEIKKLLGQDHGKILESLSTISDAEKSNLIKLISGKIDRDPNTYESPIGHEFIYLFEKLIAAHVKQKTIIEFYLTDELPDLEEFAFDDWDIKDDFGLPLSPHGTPAIVYRNSHSLKSYLDRFETLKHTEDYDCDDISESELTTLIETVRFATENEVGLFIFCTQ